MNVSHLLKEIVELVGGVPLSNDSFALIKVVLQSLEALVLFLKEVSLEILNFIWRLVYLDEKFNLVA